MEAINKKSMTEGPLLGKILLFVLPIIATNLLQVLFNSADMIIVGLSSEPDAVGAVGTVGSFVAMVLDTIIGFSVGVNIVVAIYVGSGKVDRIKKAVHTAIISSLIVGTLFGIVGVFIAKPVLATMGNKGKLLELATTYSVIYFIGAPIIAVLNSSIAIFKAKGDSKTPMYVLMVAGLINVVLNLFFVLVCKMSVDGVAIATVISNFLAMATLIIKLMKRNDECKISWKEMKIDKHCFKRIIAVAIPASLQGLFFDLSNIIIQSSLISVNNSMVPTGAAYQPVIKGNTACGNLEGFIYNATNAVYQAAVTFAGQNYGAKKPERIKRIALICYIMTTVTALLFSSIIFIAKDPLLALYSVRDGAEGTLEHLAYSTAMTKMLFIVLPYFTLALMETGAGLVRGMNKSMTAAITSLLGACVFRLIWIAFVFTPNPSLEILYLSYPISWVVTALTHFVFYNVNLRKLKKSTTAEAVATATVGETAGQTVISNAPVLQSVAETAQTEEEIDGPDKTQSK